MLEEFRFPEDMTPSMLKQRKHDCSKVETIPERTRTKRQRKSNETSSTDKKANSSTIDGQQNQLPVQLNDDQPMNFESCLSRLKKCKTFYDLKSCCQNINLEDVKGQSRYILEHALCVDVADLIDMCPTDIPDDRLMFPVSVQANGDCLPATGSVFAFGHDDHRDETQNCT